MTDRQLMQSAENRIQQILEQLSDSDDFSKEKLLEELSQIRCDIHQVTNSAIDYQVVVDNLDENILIADKTETILYVNRAYLEHTGIPQNKLIGRTVTDVLNEKKYFTVATVPDVIARKESVMKLSYLPGQEKPGVVVGTPIFDTSGDIQYVVTVNRGLSTYANLHDNYIDFLQMLQKISGQEDAVKYVNKDKELDEHTMVGSENTMQRVRRFINSVAPTDATVLITGESGTGKELIADALYRASGRRNKPFIKINCSSIPAALLESELFGYEKGAFSGANSSGKMGLFEAANTGTLLLDEIGDMPLELQAKLLRAIQSNEITRVGGTKPIKLDIRLIASTNSNLKEKIAAGTFRSDLYYRLHVIPMHVAPLRERKDDIPLLCQHYIDLFSKKYHRKVTLTDENMEILMNYSWPGNIRELRNIMEYLVICAQDGGQIDNYSLYSVFDPEAKDNFATIKQYPSLPEAIASYEKDFLALAIKNVKNLKEASEILGIDISTVSRKLKQHGLSIKK